MIEVTQVRTGKPRGQCTEASIASLLECNLEDVPDLLEPGHPDEASMELHRPQWRWIRLLEWIKSEHSRQLFLVKFIEYRPSIKAAWDEAAPLMSDALGLICNHDWWGDHLAAGHNPDGIQHQVCARVGSLLWDPNPSRRGIVNCDEIAWLVPLEFVPADYREMPGTMWQIK